MFQYACRTVAEKMDMIFIYQETKIATDKTYLTISDIDMGVNENITNTFQKTIEHKKYNPEILIYPIIH
jgi:glycosylphosphatidylinositol transamidase (GPIT) subunit GPI8